MTNDQIEALDEAKEKVRDTIDAVQNERFPNNSHRSKKTSEKKKVSQVAKGRARRRKKSAGRLFKETFVAEDITGVFSYLFYEVLVPAAKTTISDMFSNGIERLLYGDDYSSRSKKRYGPQVSYSSYYGRDRRDRPSSQRNTGTLVRVSRSFDDIVLEKRSDAEEVLTTMADLIETYGQVSIADLYDLVGIQGSHTDNKFGWEHLERAGIARTREGWVLNLPKPQDL